MAALMEDVVTADLDIVSPNWVEVVTAKNVVIQLKSTGRVNVWLVGDGGDPPGVNDVGITLARGIQGVESSFGAGNLPDNTTLWAKSLVPYDKSATTEQVTVIAY